MPHVLATASTTGYTVVWDLRGKREVVALTYGGGPGAMGGPLGGGGVSAGGRRGMSDLAWHPNNVGLSLHSTIPRSSLDDGSKGDASCHCSRRRFIADYHDVGSPKRSSPRKGKIHGLELAYPYLIPCSDSQRSPQRCTIALLV